LLQKKKTVEKKHCHLKINDIIREKNLRILAYTITGQKKKGKKEKERELC